MQRVLSELNLLKKHLHQYADVIFAVGPIFVKPHFQRVCRD